MKRSLNIAFTLAVILSLMINSVALAYVSTDQPDYSPGSVVTISGDNSDGVGFQAGEGIHVDVTGPNGYISACDTTADENGAWSCQVNLWDDASAVGSYSYIATGLASNVSQNGVFTDAAVRLKFATKGLPDGTLLTVNWTRFTPGCNGEKGSGSTLFSSPEPSSQVQACELTGKNTFDFSFPQTLGLYTLKSLSVPSGSAFSSDTIITATYEISCVAPSNSVNPENQSISYGDNAFFSASGSGNLQWQVSANGGGFTDISGETNPTLNLEIPEVSMSGNKYRAAFTNCGSTVYSSASTLTVEKASSSTVVICPVSVPFDGTAKTPCTVAVTGSGDLSLTPDPVYVNNVNAGIATASYTYAGDDNHTGSSNSATF